MPSAVTMRAVVIGLAVVALASCKKTPMDRVESIRSELEGDAPKLDAFPKCADRAACAKDVAAAIGGAYDDKKPDQISAGAAAVVVARDGHGDDLASPDVWLAAMRKAKGPGADALRLAVARRMSEHAEKHARTIDDDAGARAFMIDVATAIPGACKTYETLGGGADPDKMDPAESPDHSACVQRDLSRKDGPGTAYGQGLFRGAAGALASWKETLAALHDGSSAMSGRTKEVLDQRVATIDAATAKIALKKVDAPAGNTWSQIQQPHASKLGGDAGAPR
ncbi:MAG TPA: hypothetical protein VH054_28035 [Polyangiaceae bacterium]|jgi:hypothetical protein|nr:hypothetical protein [Polyangiaceae bacterium]